MQPSGKTPYVQCEAHCKHTLRGTAVILKSSNPCPTLLMILWLNEHKSLQRQSPVERLPRRMEAKLMPMVLEWDVQQVHLIARGPSVH